MSEVSPLDEFFVTLRANFLNKTCLNKKKKCYRDRMKSGIFEDNCSQQERVRCLWC